MAIDLVELEKIVKGFDLRLFNVERNLGIVKDLIGAKDTIENLKKKVVDTFESTSKHDLEIAALKMHSQGSQVVTEKLRSAQEKFVTEYNNQLLKVGSDVGSIKKSISDAEHAIQTHGAIFGSIQDKVNKVEAKIPTDFVKHFEFDALKACFQNDVKSYDAVIASLKSDIRIALDAIQGFEYTKSAFANDIAKIASDLKNTFDSFNAFSSSIQSLINDLKKDMASISSSIEPKIKAAIPAPVDIGPAIKDALSGLENKMRVMGLDVSNAMLKTGNVETQIKIHGKQLENAFLQIQKIQLETKS